MFLLIESWSDLTEESTSSLTSCLIGFILSDNFISPLILPPNLIVDANFKIDGTIHKFPSTTRYTLRSQEGYTQLDDKDEFTVATDNIARAVTNLEYEYSENEKKREINVLKSGYLNVFINDLKDIVRYDKSSSYIAKNLASTENTEVVNP